MMPYNDHECRFFIVTPCLNAVNTIDQTIESVVSQDGNFSIHYHVQDGGSTDGTIERLKHWQSSMRQNDLQCQRVTFTWSSRPDESMYDAIIKGFDRLVIYPDDFMSWINADDKLLPGAMNTICRISRYHPQIQWVGGPQYVIENNVKILERLVPTPTAVVREGLCDGHHWHFLQQEGMFFKKRLWFKGRHALRGFSLAGDWSLWREFARHAELVQCEKPLGAFYRREGQLSISRFEDYKREMDKTLSPKRRTAGFIRLPEMHHLHRFLIKHNNSGIPMLEKDHLAVKKEYATRWEQISHAGQTDS